MEEEGEWLSLYNTLLMQTLLYIIMYAFLYYGGV